VIIASFKIEEWMHSFFAVDMPGSYSWLLIAMMVGVVAETRYLGRPFATADNVLFLCVIFWPQQFCVCESEFNPWPGPVKLTGLANGGTGLELTLPMQSESSAQSASRFVGEADIL
jgi:hypothetical protein